MNSEARETKAVRVANTYNEETNPGRRIESSPQMSTWESISIFQKETREDQGTLPQDSR